MTSDNPNQFDHDLNSADTLSDTMTFTDRHNQTNIEPSSNQLIDLNTLTQLTPIYQKLMSGFHITEQNLTLWQSLDQHLLAYQALFKGLGYQLIKDARGYFYFSTPDTTVTMTKTSRRIALLVYTLIEHWADKGLDPVAALFEQSLAKETLQKLFDQNTSIFEQIDITSATEIKNEILKRMVRLGFAKELGKEFKLLPPCYRYIDAVLELTSPEAISPLESSIVEDDRLNSESILEDQTYTKEGEL